MNRRHEIKLERRVLIIAIDNEFVTVKIRT